MTAGPDARPDEPDLASGPHDGGDGADSDHDPDDELIDEEGEESFPASDSPSSWSGPPSESR